MLFLYIEIEIENALTATEKILSELGISEKPRLTALNKIDLLFENPDDCDEEQAIEQLATRTEIISPDTVLISGAKKWGLANLLDFAARRLSQAPVSTNHQKWASDSQI